MFGTITRTRSARLTALLAGAALGAAGAVAAPAQAAPKGDTSLAEVLAADGNKLDHNWDDFDILDKAVTGVLAAKPGSDVAVLADGGTQLTAFAPTDRAFRRLVFNLTGDRKQTERGVLRAVTKFADTDTLEQILLYHVVPGAPITYRAAKKADGATLDTALSGATVKVRVNKNDGRAVVRLRDADPDLINAKVLRSAKNINKGNQQIAHGISRVMLPIDV